MPNAQAGLRPVGIPPRGESCRPRRAAAKCHPERGPARRDEPRDLAVVVRRSFRIPPSAFRVRGISPWPLLFIPHSALPIGRNLAVVVAVAAERPKKVAPAARPGTRSRRASPEPRTGRQNPFAPPGAFPSRGSPRRPRTRVRGYGLPPLRGYGATPRLPISASDLLDIHKNDAIVSVRG